MFQNAFVAFRLFVMQYRSWFLLVFVFFGAVFQRGVEIAFNIWRTHRSVKYY